MNNFMKAVCTILVVIAAGNISVAVFLTMAKIEKADRNKKGLLSALYFVFTLLGIYAAAQLLN